MYDILWFRSCLLYDITEFCLGCYVEKTNITLGLAHDQDMYEMIEKGKRGGVCQASPKYVKANNKYMKDYDNNTISSYSTS